MHNNQPIDHKALEVDHAQWLRNPTTGLFLQGLENYKDRLVNTFSASALTGPESDLRYKASCLATVIFVLKMAKDTNVFISQATHKH
jgi:hypothetical protein